MSHENTSVATQVYSRMDCYLDMPIKRYLNRCLHDRQSQIIQETEISILVNGRYIHTLTCSPWDIEELAVGYLHLKGVLQSRQDIKSLRIDEAEGIVRVSLRKRQAVSGQGNILLFPKAVAQGASSKRPYYRDAAGLPVSSSVLQVHAEQVNALSALLERNSLLFKRTGGVHSAILIRDNKVLAWFEDIGRHSAVDKLAGCCCLNSIDPSNCILLFSGRVPYEIITKTIRLGCPVIISPGAPTNLSIKLAKEHGVTLIGFAKDNEFNVYSHQERVLL